MMQLTSDINEILQKTGHTKNKKNHRHHLDQMYLQKKTRHPCVETQSIAYTVFSRVHATLQPAMSDCLSVGRSIGHA